MKTCFKCGVEKPLDEFYAHRAMADGHLGKCKTCAKLDVRTHRATTNRPREYDRERAVLPHRIANTVKQCRTWRAEHPDGYKAHSSAAYAQRVGKLAKAFFL